MSEITWIEQWYQRQCDGNWEHQHGIKVETLDNPGWHVEIDGLPPSPSPMRYAEEVSETSWIRCSLDDGRFDGYGDPRRLQEIFALFQRWTEL